jgi:transposase
MSYRIAGIDVHKKMLAVVVADVEVQGEYQFERIRYGSNPEQLRLLAAWLIEHEVEEVVMESTAQYWKPVWGALEQYWNPTGQKREGARPMSGTLHLAQAQSNRGPRGRKKDFPDAERLLKRLVANELSLSFVPDAEQRLWRTVMRRKYQLTRNRVQLQNRLEALLEEAHIKLSSLVSDLLGASARRMLKALADGETDPAALASLADKNLRATPAQLCDALGACTKLNPVYRRLLKMFLEELQLIDQQIGQLDNEMATLLSEDQAAVQRLAEVPGLGVDSAQQIIAEVGAKAATFASAKHLSSWVGACPGEEESAGVSKSHRSPKGEPPYAAHSQSVCQRRSQVQRNHFPDRLWPTGVATGTQSNHRSYCPSALSPDLDHSAPGCTLRRTRPRSERKVKTQAYYSDDSGTSQPRLSGRSTRFSSMRAAFSTLRTERCSP